MGKCAIAAGRDLTLRAAEEVLREGGNAFDAAIAAAFMMFASEPCMASAGAGGFAMCHSANGPTEFLDFFTQTPKSKQISRQTNFYPVEVDFGVEKETFHVGAASVATPGMIAGICAIHDRYATMPLRDLVHPAQSAAKEGVEVDAFGEIDMALLQEIFRLEPSVEDIFFKDGRIKKRGEKMLYPHLPDFLDMIAEEGARGFYQGEIGARIDAMMEGGQGFLTRQDLEEYQVHWRRPLRMAYQNKDLYLPNGPSQGGAIIALIHALTRNNSDSHVEVFRRVKQEIHEQDRVAEHMSRMLPEMGFTASEGSRHERGTSHFSIMDDLGNAIGMTLSIGEGSGCWIPGTDTQLNNMLGEIYLLPNGAHSWIPDARLRSMMCPVMISEMDGALSYVGGSGGAGRIPYVIYQVLEAHYRDGLSLEDATRAPRFHWHEQVLQYEEGMDIPTAFDQVDKRLWAEDSLFFGGVHSLSKGSDGRVEACGDPRRHGVSMVFGR